MIAKNVWYFLSTPYGLFVHFGVLALAAVLLLYKPVMQFDNRDIAPELLQKESQEIAAIIKEHNPTQVEVGFALDNFSDFDFIKNEFGAVGIVWFLYDPNKVSLEDLERFSIVNGFIEQKSEAAVQDVGDKKLSRFHLRLKFTNDLNFRNFPVDDHRLYIIIKNNHLQLKDVEFVTRPSNFVETVKHEEKGWTLIDTHAFTGFRKEVLQTNGDVTALYSSQAVFSLDYSRSGIHLLIIVLLPLFLLFFVALSVFLVRIPSIYDASNTFMGSLFALTGYLFVLESISPQVGYIMLIDLIYFAILLSTFVIATLSWAGHKLKYHERGLIGTTIEAILILVLFGILYIWR